MQYQVRDGLTLTPRYATSLGNKPPSRSGRRAVLATGDAAVKPCSDPWARGNTVATISPGRTPPAGSVHRSDE